MNKIRIIPRLDIKGPNLVKGIHLEGLRVLGKPERYAKYYYENGADELFFQDTVASLYERNSLHDIISKTAKEIFIPLTVGGGIRSIDNIKSVLRAGADKVSINTAAIRRPEFIREAALSFGSSTIVVTIEAIKESAGNFFVYTDSGREHTGIEVLDWAKQVEELGAGELIITSVDKEGTGEGFDIDLINKISRAVSIPVIAHGGLGKPSDAVKVVKEGDVDAISMASVLHYDYITKQRHNDEFEEEGNISFLKSGNIYGKITPSTIQDIKLAMHDAGIPVRLNSKRR
ncbi:MAG: imidazole glycerol phosphate synthase subunit HisF [Bacteroidetes bacterium]|nr:imidazole glycerol phosphate synthase subunit HisF [Bacteroidota bacterium]